MCDAVSQRISVGSVRCRSHSGTSCKALACRVKNVRHGTRCRSAMTAQAAACPRPTCRPSRRCRTMLIVVSIGACLGAAASPARPAIAGPAGAPTSWPAGFASALRRSSPRSFSWRRRDRRVRRGPWRSSTASWSFSARSRFTRNSTRRSSDSSTRCHRDSRPSFVPRPCTRAAAFPGATSRTGRIRSPSPAPRTPAITATG